MRQCSRTCAIVSWPVAAWFAILVIGICPLVSHGEEAESGGGSIWDGGTLFLWSGQEEDDGQSKRDEPLASDRPDFTEASTTVGRGLAQCEMGYTLFHDNEAGAHSTAHSYPEMLWRIGLFADWFELRIQYNHGSEQARIEPLPEVNNAGSHDLYLGLKLALTNQDGWLPEMAITPQTLVPTGHRAFTAGEVLPGVNWLYGWDINDFLAVGASTQANMRIDEDRDYLEFAQSVTINYTFAEHLGGYTEWFVLAPSGAQTVKPEYYFDGGFIFPITNNLQFDIRAGVGLNPAATDFFAGSGMVVRL
jgi:hypothetical protein